MEKIKNLLNPGRKEDNETLYGSGTNTGIAGTHGGLTGEGSHLASNTGNNSQLAGSQTTGPSGIGSANTGVASEASTDQSGRAVGNTGSGLGQSSTASGLPGQGSHLASATSGLPSNQTLGLGNTTSGSTGNQTSGLNSTTTSSHMPGSWEDSYEQGSGNTLAGSNRSTGLGSNTGNLASANSQGTSQLGSTTGSSGISRSANTSGHHLGRDAAAVGTAGAVGEGIHHHRENERNLGSNTGNLRSSNPADSGLGSATVFPTTTSHSTQLGSGSNTGNLGSSTTADSGLGSATVFPTTTSHSTQLGSGSNYPSTTSGTLGYTSTLPDRSMNSQQPGATTGYGSNQTGSTSSGHHLGRDTAALGTAGAVGEGIHHHRDHERGVADQGYTGTNRTMPLSSSTGHTSGSQPLSSTAGAGSHIGYGNTSSGNTTSGSHLGRDAAAIGTAGAVGEDIHHHREHDRGLGSSEATSGSHAYNSTTGPHSTNIANLLDPNTSGGAQTHEDAHVHNPRHGGGAEAADKDHGPSSKTTTGATHPLSRDAAFGAGGVGAAGLAEHEHNKHHNDRNVGGTSGIGQRTTATGTSTSRTDPTSSSTGRDHHYGRNTAVGAGGVGAAGLAAHEYNKHDRNQGAYSGATAGTTNPTSTSTSNQTAPALTGRDQTSTSTTNPTTSTSAGRDHHYGRDAAVGAGGVGAAGLAGREYEKHHDGSTGTGTTSGLSQSTSGASSLPGPAPNTSGPHSKDWMNKLDPRVTTNPTVAQGNPQAESTLSSLKPSAETGGYGVGSTGTSHPTSSTTNPTTSTSTGKDHHYGRDAAVGGGVGAAAYEAEKHHSGKHATQEPNQLGNPGASAITGNPYPSRDATTTGNVAHYGDPTTDSERSKDHHYGRDAAVAGGVGGAAYEADKHYKHDKDLSQAERDAKKQHKHDEKELKKEHKHEQKESHKDSKSGGGLFGFLHRDKNKKYSPDEEAEFDRQEREHNSHKGRDAALGTAGVGALGAGAYEAEKHYGQQTSSSTTGHTGSEGHHGPTPLVEKPVGKDLGDYLHGPERNRGVSGSSGVPGSEGYGTGSGVHSEASTDQYGNPIGSGVSSGTGNQSHLGRDAALGAGAAGIAGAGVHEHQKHDSGYQQAATGYDNRTSGSGVTGSQGQHGYQQGSTGYDNLTSGSGLTGSQQGQHHYGRDAAAVGGAGALGEHEYRKHEGTTSQQPSSGYGQQSSGVTGSNNQYDNAGIGSGQQLSSSGYGSNTIDDPANDGRIGPNIDGSTTSHKGPSVVEGSDGRHRLHKDPPANHPASGASHVPATGSETQRMMQEGRQRIDGNTGVANPGNDRNNY